MTDRPYDLVVVGGGPAGLTAAVTAAGAGLRTVVLDESPELGGQYFRQQPPSLLARGEHRPAGRRLIDQVKRSRVDVLTSHVVWGADETGALLATPPDGAARRIAGEYTLIAAGAHELLLPFPGWTLPGVVTPGFAMHTAVVNGARLGERVVVAGTGPFLLLVAQELLRAGVPVAAVADEAPVAPTPGNFYRAAGHPRQLGQFGGMLATLARHRVPWWRSTRLLAAEGGPDGVRRVVLGAARDRREPDTPRSVGADIVCVAYGFRPNSELPLLLGCDCRPDPVTGALAPVTDQAGRTTVPRMYAAGDGAGIGGAELAMARAYLAVADICAARGHRLPAATVRRHQRLAQRQASFARLNARLFPPPLHRAAELADDVVVCRCEAVSAGSIRAAAATGWYDDSAIKAVTRAGMGPCQGRECTAAVAVITRAVLAGQAVRGAPGAGGEPAAWSPREPVRPVRLASVAAAGTLPGGLASRDGDGSAAGSGQE
jgi:NADPH-dependent 2,4-dienoyl-CoA reductase/sulfur reductase-like enzyme